jgi:thiamine biosynthesis lipoprotein
VRGALWPCLALACLPATGLAGGELAWSERRAEVYGGIPARVQVALPAARSAEAEALTLEGLEEIRRVGRVFNAFDPGSEIGRLNAREEAGPAPVSAELADVLAGCRRVWQQTGGAFDPTVWPLKRLWREAARAGVPPTDEALGRALSRVGLGRTRLAPGRLQRDLPGMAFDLGGYIKGHAVGRVAGLLGRAGAERYLVQLGGEIAARGRSPSGEPWRLGVQHPLEAGRLWGVLSAEGAVCVSTSGNYQQPVRVGDVLYYHIFDPRTGRPVPTRLLGITVIVWGQSPDCAEADGLATALAVLGPEEGERVLASRPGRGAVFIVRGEADRPEERVSPALTGLYRRTAE